MKISPMAVAQSMMPPQAFAQDSGRHIDADEFFRPYEPPKGVLPAGQTAKIAMDEAGFDIGMFAAMAGGIFSGAFEEGQLFPGYPILAQWALRPENRLMVSTRATEMTRKWIKFTTKGEGDTDSKHEKIAKIEAEFRRLQVRDRFREMAEKDGYFGRGHLHLDTGHADDATDAELRTSIGNGSDATSLAKVSPKNPLRGLNIVEPMWTYPNVYNSFNPLSRTWYRPDQWYVMGKSVHVTRLLRFCSQEVPDILKPAYAFGGLSMSQMAKPYIDNWLRTRQSVQELITSFSQFALGTNTSGLDGAGGEDVFRRVDIFNNLRNNRGTFLYDKDTEDFKNVSAPLGGLDHLQAQAQEHCASISRMPLVLYTGISPSGLNASSEGEMKCWDNLVHSEQENLFRDPITTVLHFAQLSLFGEIDPDIDFEFLPLNEMSEEQKATLRKTNADTDAVLIETGVISQHEARARVANDPDSPYADLDIDEMPDLAGEEEEGLMPSGEANNAGKPKLGAGTGAKPRAEGAPDADEESEDAATDAEKHARKRPAPRLDFRGKGLDLDSEDLDLDDAGLDLDEKGLDFGGKGLSLKGHKLALDRLLAEDAEPKTLYVSRPLKNAAEFRAWAKAQGFKSVLPAGDLHVTIAYSKKPVDWNAAGDSFDTETVPAISRARGPRSIEKLGDAVVLRFQSPDLTRRWKQFKDAGASWDYDSYKPHISITYDAGDIDLDEVEPYMGLLEFGPEKFGEVRTDDLAEDEALWKESDHPRKPNGEFGEGGGAGHHADHEPHMGVSGGISKGNKQALKHYTGAGFKAVNGHLVGGREADEATKATIAYLDDLMSRASLPEASKVYRGAGSLAVKSILDQAGGVLRKGQIINCAGFTSTSANPTIAEGFANQSRSAILIEMRLPKGAKAVDIAKYSDVGVHEKELLIARNSSFKVVSFTKPNKLVLEMVMAQEAHRKIGAQDRRIIFDESSSDRFNWENGAGVDVSGPDDGEVVFTLANLRAVAKGQSVTSDELAADAEFKEGDHPRAPDGRFGEKAGEHGGSKAKAPKEKKAAKPKAEKPASWVLRNKDTGEVVGETSHEHVTKAINTAKYEAVPSHQHLGELNQKGSKARAWAERPAEPAPKQEPKPKAEKKDPTPKKEKAAPKAKSAPSEPTKESIGQYQYTPEEKTHALVWGAEGGLGAASMVKQGAKLGSLPDDIRHGTGKAQSQSLLRANLIAQNAGHLAREHAGNEAHKAAADDVVKASHALQNAIRDKDNSDLSGTVRDLQASLARFQRYTIKEASNITAKLDKGEKEAKKANAAVAKKESAPKKQPPKPKFADALAPDLGRKLTAAAHQRARFDVLLKEYEAAYKPAELRAIAHCFMGYDVDKKKKGDIIKAMRNWQREAELNDDIHAAQAKIPV